MGTVSAWWDAAGQALARACRAKDLLFVIHNEIMWSHAAACQAAIRFDPRIRSWWCLVEPRLCVDASAMQRLRPGRVISRAEATARAWDLVIFPDHEAGFLEGCRAIYIGHGHYAGKSVEPGGDYVFGDWSRDARGRFRYEKIFRPSEFLARRACTLYPDAAAHVRVVGSPFADELRRARGVRKAPDRAWGFDAARRTVFLAFTWGVRSVVQSQGDVLARQVAALAARYNVIISAHLNNFQLRQGRTIPWTEFAGGLAGRGVHVVPPTEPSYRLLPCADLLVMELSSLGFYYTVLGRPILYYDNPRIPYLPTSLVEELKQAAHVITDLSHVDAQVDQAFDAFDPSAMREVAEKAFSHPGASRTRYRQEIRESLGLGG